MSIIGELQAGLIRIDSNDLFVSSSFSYLKGAPKSLPSYLRIYQPSAGTVRLENNTLSNQSVKLVGIE